MSGVAVKICGVRSVEAVEAAIAGRARWVGLNFYPPSPRAVDLALAARLAEVALDRIGRVGVFVDPDDALLDAATRAGRLDLIQLHGSETPQRAAEVKARIGLPVMKAIGVAGPADLERAQAFIGTVDRLLFDAKPPKRADALPGGNALSFDWRLLAGRSWDVPWMLSGGLHPGNVAEAIHLVRPPGVDVSSGIERAPGDKDPALIRAFLAAVEGADVD